LRPNPAPPESLGCSDDRLLSTTPEMFELYYDDDVVERRRRDHDV